MSLPPVRVLVVLSSSFCLEILFLASCLLLGGAAGGAWGQGQPRSLQGVSQPAYTLGLGSGSGGGGGPNYLRGAGIADHDPRVRTLDLATDFTTAGGSGEILVVGAKNAVREFAGVNLTVGSASIFVRAQSTDPWILEQTIWASNAQFQPGMEFGHCVAVHGGGDDQGFSTQAASGPRIAVGSVGEGACNASSPVSDTSCSGTQAGFGAGAVFLFALDPASAGNALGSRVWVETDRLKQDLHGGDSTNERLGWSVALSAETLAVGIFYENSCGRGINPPVDLNCPQSGAVLAFTLPAVPGAAAATRDTYFKASNTVATGTENFGGSVAIHGNTLAVGSDDESSCLGAPLTKTCTNSGAVYIFRRPGGPGTAWSQDVMIKRSGDQTFFGSSLALHGNTVAIAAPLEDSCATLLNGNQADTGCTDAGAVFVWERPSSSSPSWSEVLYVKGYASIAGMNFGRLVSLREDGLVLGVAADNEDACPNALPPSQAPLDTSCADAGAVTLLTRESAASSFNHSGFLKAGFNSYPQFTRFGSSLEITAGTVAVTGFESIHSFNDVLPPFVTTTGAAASGAVSSSATTTTTITTTTTSIGSPTSSSAGTVATISTTSATSTSSSSARADSGDAGSEDEPFPWWIIGAAAGGCCVLLLLVVILLVVLRRKREDSSESSQVELENYEEANDIYASISHEFRASTPGHDQLKPAEDVAREGDYARLNDVDSVVGPYFSVSKVLEQSELTPESIMDGLDAAEVFVDVTQAIGQGEFGDVFFGVYRETEVAVKMLKENFTDQQLQSFYDEAKIISMIPQHENVVGFLGATPDPFMIITEYCSNGSLRFFLRNPKTALSIEQELKVVRDVAAGMQHLSAAGVVHRDLAARNVLLTADLVPKIADFGMSRKFEEGSSVHQSKTAQGPALWMAVESVRKGEYTEQSDVWAFAVTAWECHNKGSQPYQKHGTALEALRKILKEGLRLQYPEALPSWVRDLYAQCTVESPSKRPTFKQIVHEFDRNEGEVVYASLSSFKASGESVEFASFRDPILIA